MLLCAAPWAMGVRGRRSATSSALVEVRQKRTAYEELFRPPGGDAQPLVPFATRRHAQCQVGGMWCRVARSLRGERDAAVLSATRPVRPKDGRRLVLHWETKGEYACVLDAAQRVDDRVCVYLACHRGETPPTRRRWRVSFTNRRAIENQHQALGWAPPASRGRN